MNALKPFRKRTPAMTRLSTRLLFVLGIMLTIVPATMSQYGSQKARIERVGEAEREAARKSALSPAFRQLASPTKSVPMSVVTPEPTPLEPLSVTGQTFLVTTVEDSVPGSLRLAIRLANETPGLDKIAFALPGTGVQTIIPGSKLPDLTDSVVIDGTTQPGYAGSPVIMIDGTRVPAGTNALVIMGGGTTVRGLAIGNFLPNGINNGFAIVLDSLGGNTIEGCYLGTDATGMTAHPNAAGIGVFGGSGGNRIGGADAAARNIISGNLYDGIQISTGSAGGNRIRGNYIGLKSNSYDPLGNHWHGIFIDASHDSIGGSFPGEGNAVVDNDLPGIYVGANATRTTIQGNGIGCNFTYYVSLLGNHSEGLMIAGSDHLIGGTGPLASNSIDGSLGAGILLIGGGATRDTVLNNFVGADLGFSHGASRGNATGIYILNAPGNYIAGNEVSNNAGDGMLIQGSSSRGTIIQRNIIGSTGNFYVTGSGNSGVGVHIINAPGNLVGGALTGMGNVITLNTRGVAIEGDTAKGNLVVRNTIGPDPYAGNGNTSTWGNRSDGVFISASQDTIRENTISYNHGCGILDSTGSENLFQRNAILHNDGLGIDLWPRGLTPNDISFDLDEGPNHLQNYPIIDSVSFNPGGSITAHCRLMSSRNAIFTVELFKSDTCNASRFGEGAVFLGDTTVSTDVLGQVLFNVTLPGPCSVRDYFTATATDALGNTSEFSRGMRMLDTDGDGLLDIWEEQGGGIDWNADGVIDLDLWSKGARVDHKDIFVEVDWMASTPPLPGALDHVVSAFSRAPNSLVNNPDGVGGINLHIETSPGDPPIADATWYTNTWPLFFAEKRTHFGTSALRADPNWTNMLQARLLVYRYCIFAIDYAANHSSGLAHVAPDPVLGGLLPASDFFVSLGGWAGVGVPVTADIQAGTFMHELGHTLGLGHGGIDTIMYKQNYFSGMNYFWQVPLNLFGESGWRLGYSEWRLPDLDEHNLIERDGLNPGNLRVPTATVPYQRASAPPSNIGLAKLQARNVPVDWDGNGDSSGNANRWMTLNQVDFSIPGAPDHVLRGWNDWESLKYSFRNSVGFFDRGTAPAAPLGKVAAGSFDELTPAILDSLRQLPPYGILQQVSDWSSDVSTGRRVAGSLNGQLALAWPNSSASAGTGGSYVTWWWSRSNPFSPEARIQRVDTSGGNSWVSTGQVTVTAVDATTPAAMLPDGHGGLFAVVYKTPNQGLNSVPFLPTSVIAQRVDASGRTLWGDPGKEVSLPGAVTNLLPEMCTVTDGRGGLVVVWIEQRGYSWAIMAQRLDSAGTPLWTPGGVVVSPATDLSQLTKKESYLRAISDDSSGVIVCWVDGFHGVDDNDIRAQRLGPDGSLLWGQQGLAVRVAPGTQFFVTMVPNGDGGAFIAWNDVQRTGYPYFTLTSAIVFMQKISRAGQLAWNPAGIPVSTLSTRMFSLGTASDGAGGVITYWHDTHPPPSDICSLFAQRIGGDGSLLWGAAGVLLSDSLIVNGDLVLPAIATPGGGIVGWPGTNATILVQNIDTSGNVRWKTGGVHVLEGGSSFSGLTFSLVSDGANGVVIYYDDGKYVYAQHVTGRGALGGTLLTDVIDRTREIPGQSRLEQNYPNPFNPSTTIQFTLAVASKVTLRIYNVLGQEVASLVNEHRGAGQHTVVWNAAGRASGVYFCRIQATGNDGKLFTQTKKLLMIR
jgi:hypothetical protein